VLVANLGQIGYRIGYSKHVHARAKHTQYSSMLNAFSARRSTRVLLESGTMIASILIKLVCIIPNNYLGTWNVRYALQHE